MKIIKPEPKKDAKRVDRRLLGGDLYRCKPNESMIIANDYLNHGIVYILRR